MQKLIRNEWIRTLNEPYERAQLTRRDVQPEGLDLARLRFTEPGVLALDPRDGHLISVLVGEPKLKVEGETDPLFLAPGRHVYLPPNANARISAEAGTQLLTVSSPNARGEQLIVRDEMFLAACAAEGQALRWVLTPQYLSRRIFLHHDRISLSKNGDPVSWFRTTMFDVAGLPTNDQGEPVFKMSYNSKTEINVLYEVSGAARVRMARHPYAAAEQRWDDWLPLSGDTAYHLNEAAGGPEEEATVDPARGERRTFRNKHEVHVERGGHASLFCLFDPAPTGVERHRPGEYSDYEPLAQVLGTPEYTKHQRAIAKLDRMIDVLSLAMARGKGDLEALPEWEVYREGRAAQLAFERALAEALEAEGGGRAQVITPWRSPHE